ncbi:hypothetical protein RU98_GL000644 [Enterococcus caccae]|nr:hypothetical protein RU98_GL000644 [Enterococcus caccae]
MQVSFPFFRTKKLPDWAKPTQTAFIAYINIDGRVEKQGNK